MTLGTHDPFLYTHPSAEVLQNATVSVQTGTEDTSYVATNVNDFSFASIAKPGKIAETSGAWLADFGGAQRVDLVVLWHNFDAGVTGHIQMNAANSWAGPTVNMAFTAPAKRADGFTRKLFFYLPQASGYTTSGLRYLRIVTGSASSNPIGIKALAFSGVHQLSRDFQWGVADEEHQISIVQKTDAGVRWAYDLSSAPRSIRGSAMLSDTDAESVREWFRACAGPVTPTVIVPEPTGTDAWIVFWSPSGISITASELLVTPQANTRLVTDANATTLAFEEVTAGDPEWF